mgnify:FL=1
MKQMDLRMAKQSLSARVEVSPRQVALEMVRRAAARQAPRPVVSTILATWSRVRCRGHCLPTISQEQVYLAVACSDGDATGCKREAARQALACDYDRAPLFGLQRGTAVLGDRKIVGS